MLFRSNLNLCVSIPDFSVGTGLLVTRLSALSLSVVVLAVALTGAAVHILHLHRLLGARGASGQQARVLRLLPVSCL